MEHHWWTDRKVEHHGIIVVDILANHYPKYPPQNKCIRIAYSRCSVVVKHALYATYDGMEIFICPIMNCGWKEWRKIFVKIKYLRILTSGSGYWHALPYLSMWFHVDIYLRAKY